MLERMVRRRFVCELGNQTDLEQAIYIRGIKPGGSSSQESCAADIRGVLVFKVFLGKFEEPFGVHACTCAEYSGGGTESLHGIYVGGGAHRSSTEKAENSRESIT